MAKSLNYLNIYPPFFLIQLKKLTVLRYSDGHLTFIWSSFSNSKHEYYISWRLADATKSTDMKLYFFRKMADDIEEWEMLSKMVQSWVGSDRMLGLT